MEKKAKIIATLGQSIYSENKLKKIVNISVNKFKIKFKIVKKLNSKLNPWT